MRIQEIIVVEGRNDITAVKRAVKAEIIATGGVYFGEDLMSLLEKAYKEKGLILFLDPDYTGELIRKKLLEKFPKSKNAYLTKDQTIKKEDIGIEHAKTEDIIKALKNSHSTESETRVEFTLEDLFHYGLTGPNSKEKRARIGQKLQIGYANGKQFLNRLNHYGIKREDLERILND